MENKEILYRVDIFYNEGITKDGRKYKVPHTCSFGVNMTVQLNGGMRTAVAWDDIKGTYFIVYDAKKAGFKVNNKGYIELTLTDE